MRVLNVVLPESPHSVGHLNALASAGWEVHAVPSYPARFLTGLDSSVRVHHHAPLPDPRTHSRRAADAWRAMQRRARVAGFRVIVSAEQALLARGFDSGVGRFAPDPVAPPRRDHKIPAPPPPAQAPDDAVSRLIGIARDPAWTQRAAPWLAGLIDEIRPDVLHSGPLLQTGPLAFAARSLLGTWSPPWLVSNWGSDLQHATRDPSQRAAVETMLSHADFYFAECERDIGLARSHGFAGAVAGIAPIGGGLDLAVTDAWRRPGPTSARRSIMIKGYQGEVGRALVALEAVRRCAQLVRDYEVVLYGTTPEVSLAAELLAADTGVRINAYSPGSRTHAQVMRDHGRARISIGLSLVDGLSTWAVEAMVMGAFPVQSATACLDEWVRDGESALFVHPEQPDEVAAAIERALVDDALVDRAAKINRAAAELRFDRAVAVPKMLAAYRRCTAGGTTPASARSRPRLTSGPVEPAGFVLNSIPKSGSHMLAQALLRTTQRQQWVGLYEGWPPQIQAHRAAIEAAREATPEQPPIVKAHVFHSVEWNDLRRELGLRMVFLYRDPRDVVVSYVHWLTGPDRYVGAIQTYIRDELDDHQARLRAMISGFAFAGFIQPDIGTFLARFAPWATEPDVCSVTFEELVARETRAAALRRIYRHVRDDARHPPHVEDEMLRAMDEAMAPEYSTTFRRGVVGSWRDEFDADTLALFYAVAGDVTAELGYAR